MDHPIVRSLVAVVAGLVVAMVVIAGVEAVGHALYPPPPGLDLARAEDQARMMEALPTEAKVAVVVAWFLGSLAGACAAIAIARRVVPAWIVAVAIAGLGLWTTQMFPHPDWMLASAVVLPLVAVIVAKRLMVRRLAPPAI
jgi:ABC-type xylose transport system permease subunit